MIPPAAVAAFFVGALAVVTLVFAADRRAIRQEQAFWQELADDALVGYGRIFDWAEEPDL